MIADSGKDKMRKSEHTEEQIVSKLKRVETEVKRCGRNSAVGSRPPCE